VKTLVFLHGWGASGAVWRRQEEAFAGEFRVLTPDMPAWEAGWLAAYLQGLPLKDAVLVGWSLGGMVLLETLRSLAEKPGGLVLVGVAAAFCRQPDQPFGPEAAMVRAMRRALNPDPGRVFREFANRCLAPGEEVFREEAEAVFAHHAPAAPLAQGLDYLVQKDLRGLLSRVQGRVAVVQGEADAIVPPDQGRWLAGWIPGARLFLLPGTGHLPFLTQAAVFNGILRGFCQDAGL